MMIFGIGLSKTGTTSLAKALDILGYRVKDNPGLTKYIAGDLSSMDGKLFESHDAFTDTPIPSFYRELDKEFPNSKFVLTIRDMDGWLRSCKKQFNKKLADKNNDAHNRLFKDLYGCTVFDEQKFKDGYNKFNQGVKEYFRDRPNDLLIMDVAGGDGWHKLCTFLNTPEPKLPFPKANVTRIRWINIVDVVAIAREAGSIVHKSHERSNSVARGTRLRKLIDLIATKILGIDMMQKTLIASDGIITEKLKALDSQIPIISKTDSNLSKAPKPMPSHFWLVDPLDGDVEFAKGSTSYSINIALIEDRSPILGVVYAPALDTIYYSVEGKSGYKIVNSGEVKELTAVEPDKLPRGKPQNIASTALAICLAMEGEHEIKELDPGTMEWETACAHAILKAVGQNISESATHEELSYSKENFINGSLNLD